MNLNHRYPTLKPQYFLAFIVIMLALFLLVIKDQSRSKSPSTFSISPELQLEQAVKAGKPSLVFFHSNNCQQCLTMIDTVAQVYPDFRDDLVLVDINVYEEINQPMIKNIGLKYIPTLIFFDKYGQSDIHVGVMPAEILRDRLSSLLKTE